MSIPNHIIRDHPGVGELSVLTAWRGSVAHGMFVPSSDPNSIDDKDVMAATSVCSSSGRKAPDLQHLSRDLLRCAHGCHGPQGALGGVAVGGRSVLQSMPDEWQQRFVGALNELDEAFGHLRPASYYVRVYKREPEMITPQIDCEECDGTGVKGDDDCQYCEGLGTVDDPEGERYETAEEVGFKTDPVPHYNRGRTRLEPRNTNA